MRHVRVRVLFALAVVAGATTLAVAVTAALTPKPVPVVTEREVAVAKLADLTAEVPAFTTSAELTGLARKAWDLRAAGGPYYPMGAPRVTELPIVLVRTDGSVRAFIGIDPRNGCRLDVRPVVMQSSAPPVTTLHDVCHGSLYDLRGVRIGGPSPWDLDELVATVRGGVVFIDRRSVIPGRVMR